jgi:hypothetical protein
VTTISGHSGSTPPAPGIPQPKASAQIFPRYAAFNPANGDIAIAQTKAGSVFVELIVGSDTSTRYNIETDPGPPPVFGGTLTSGDVYIVAGTGTNGLIADPGNNQFGDSTSPAATANPITPTSIAFDHNGNILIAGRNSNNSEVSAGASAIQVVAKSTGTFYGVSMTAGNLYTIADVGLSGAPATAINMGDVAAVADGMSLDPQGNIVVGDGVGAIFVNTQTSGSLNLYGLNIPHQSSQVIAGNAQGTTHCSPGAANTAASGLFLQSAAPFVDASDNVYVNDNEGGAGVGCVWALPAQSGTFDGLNVTAGNAYKLAGNGGTTSTADGTAGVNANVAGTSGITIDPAGNVVLGVSGTAAGTSHAIQILAESTCASSCNWGLASTTAGDIYTIASGSSPGPANLTGPSSVLSDGTGNLYVTDGVTGSANLDEATGGPAALPVVTSVNPNAGPLAGGTAVTISSSVPNFTGATAVHFAALAATPFTVSPSGSQITTTSPGPGAGTVDVTVTTPAGTSAVTSADQFTYEPAPTVTGVAPTSGSTSGGTSVTITGTSFTGATAVHFGANAATGVVVNSASSISAISPMGAGTVDVTVTTPGGTSTANPPGDQFTYIPAPTVTGVSPSAGPLVGGTPVTITGTNFMGTGFGAATVMFGANAATGVVVNSASSISAISPMGAGTVDVRVTTANGGTSAANPPGDQFTYDPVPTVTGVSPNAGPLAGGTAVTITGTGFVAGATVHFGASAAPGAVVNSATSISVPSPSHGAGTVDVTVTTPGGTSAANPPGDQFTYDVVPTVSAVSPSSGPGAGGTGVTITGTGFVAGATVHFGANAATGVVVNSATSISATSPAGAGTVDVTVTTPGGTSAANPPGDQFKFIAAPTVTSVSPNTGPDAGGTSVTITGTGFLGDAATVSFGGAAATNVVVNSDTSITATSPAGAGTVDVTVTTGGGTSATSGADHFTYVAPVLGYWFVGSDGGIFSYGGAGFFGSTGGMVLNKPIVGMAATPDGNGYWLVASDGGIFAYGDAQFYGSTGAMRLNKPIVGMAATPDGKGYWLVASDGGIFAYGDATFFGSTGAIHLNKPIVGMAVTHDGNGYWFVGSDGGIFAYGDATFLGSTGALTLNKPIVGMAATPDGNGYWFVGTDGGIFAYGDAQFYGSTGSLTLNKPIVGMAATPDGNGYWFVGSDGGIFNYGDATFSGSTGGMPLNKPIVGMAAQPGGA